MPQFDRCLTDRRKFFRESAIWVFGFLGIPLFLNACGSSTGSDAAAPVSGGNCDQNGSQTETTGSTESHTHTITITAAQIQAANTSAVFTTSSTGGHTHPVQLTAPQYTSLQANQGISTNTGSGGDGHTHTLTINCA